MGQRDFETVLLELQHPACEDFWKLSLLKTLAKTAFFKVLQGVRILHCFTWSRERVEACIVLFGRVVDTENMHILTATLKKGEQRELFDVLGMAAYLRSENPTGRYNLNLSREVDRVVASRLLMQAQKEEFWRSSQMMRNFRDVELKGKKIEITDPLNFNFPAEGIVSFDFIVYERGTIVETLKKKKASHRTRFRAVDNINFLRLAGAIQSLRELTAAIDKGLRPETPLPPSLLRNLSRKASESVSPSSAGAPGTRMKISVPPPALLPPSTPGNTPAPASSIVTPRSAGARMMLQAARSTKTDMLKDMSIRSRGPKLGQGKSLREMIEAAITHESKRQAEGSNDGVVNTKDFADIIQKVDAQAELLVKEDKLQALAKEAEKGSGRLAAPGPGQPKNKSRLLWSNAVAKISSLNMVHQGMANMFDFSLSKVSPITVVRTFGNEHYITCDQVLQLIWLFDPMNADDSVTRVTIIQILFTRIVDLWHFADILRECTPAEQVQVMQRLGYHNCIYTSRRDLSHLHGICFLLRLSVEEEYRVARTLADYSESIPKTPMPGQPPRAVFRHLLINGSPANMSEDRQFWVTLNILANNRRRPDSTWDPKGTIEFQLMFPEPWLRGVAAQTIQRIWRGNLGRKVAQRLFDEEQMAKIQGSSVAMSVGNLLAGRARKTSPITDKLLADKALQAIGDGRPNSRASNRSKSSGSTSTSRPMSRLGRD
mmetsp:Transcript_21235/g.59033  ORF Transcript_21235/g.59033 Transcript_21235/m.59033 type:complete len:715 (-) Transcript_21235:33-2177(-)